MEPASYGAATVMRRVLSTSGRLVMTVRETDVVILSSAVEGSVSAHLESWSRTSLSGTQMRSMDGAPLVPDGTPFQNVPHSIAYRSGKSILPRTCAKRASLVATRRGIHRQAPLIKRRGYDKQERPDDHSCRVLQVRPGIPEDEHTCLGNTAYSP